MTGETLALLVAVIVPIVILTAVFGLIAGLKSLELSRDELIELARRRDA